MRLGDILHLFFFLAALPVAAVCRRRRPRLWLLCETGEEARDNAWALFRYLRERHPEQDAVYAIRSSSRDWGKAAALGETVEYGSFRHWVLYLAAQRNISTQKGGKPNAAVCYLLEVKLGLLRNCRVFLQHGVTKDDVPYLHWQDTRMRLFVCAANPEYRFVLERFGYPPGAVQKLGFCRYDTLGEGRVKPRQVAVVPTWRDYIFYRCPEGDPAAFLETHYCRAWRSFLEDPRLAALLEERDLTLVFCPHRKMAGYLDAFPAGGGRITRAAWDETDIQTLLGESELLVTDYSSVAMDFAYLGRPVLYYQFDQEEYRQGHLPQGYFDYRRDGFGPVCTGEEDLLRELRGAAERGFSLPEEYRRRQEAFFAFRDRENCERNYRAILELGQGEEKA